MDPRAAPHLSEPGRSGLDWLAAADSVLDGYYQTLFRVTLDRLRGLDGTPAPEPPGELLPFLRFKPARAVANAQVRKALRELLEDEPTLAEAVAAAHTGRAGDPEPDLGSVRDAARSADTALLRRLASAAAAGRPEGWEVTVTAAAVADAAVEAGLAAGEAEGVRRGESAARRSARENERLAERVDALEAALERAEDELGRLRAERKSLRSELDRTSAAAARAEARAGGAASEAAALGRERDELAERVETLTAALRGQESASARTESELRSRISQLEAALIPDLEPHARRLERLAEDLRETMRHMAGTGGAGSEVRRRRRTDFPKGIFPDSAAAVHWALGQPGLVLLVDGYNVTRQPTRGWGEHPLEQQRQLLLTRCGQVLQPAGAEIRIVFDSSEPGDFAVSRRTRPGLHVEFSGGPIADDRLVQIVEALDPAVAVVAVTSDLELQARLAALGASPVPSDVFLEAIGAPVR